ncbi:MAG: galactose mutarotase [Holophagales bacterium]|jgi:aldose 1-epimerase|nr:galactose mutarotase [Holophagales bacterium]
MNSQTSIFRSPFGADEQGRRVELFTLSNSGGMAVQITNFGGKLVSLMAPDANGLLADVVLGYSTFAEWKAGNPYFGAIIGRYANRIAKGRFELGGKTYDLVKNNGANALHGGPIFGFHNVIWEAEELFENGGNPCGLRLLYSSKDGEEGYPGNLKVRVTYSLSYDNELSIRYSAVTDRPTPVSLTHHSFFNLRGAGNGDILGHRLMINADAFTPIDSTQIPTGEIRKVAETPFDFTSFRAIGERIGDNDPQLEYGNGYDHNFVLRGESAADGQLRLAAAVLEPKSGRRMEVLTTEPGLQLYSGNFLDGSDIGKGGRRYGQRSAFCLETQRFPDSPNQSHFPNSILMPGETYESRTVYRFPR